MYECGKIVGQNIAGNDEAVVPTKYASSENRNNTLDELTGLNNFAENGGFDLSMPEEGFPENQTDTVVQFNSRLDLNYELPSTVNVSRYNTQRNSD